MAITNKDELIRENQRRLTALETRVSKPYADYDSVMGMVQDLVEVVNGDTKVIEDIGARLEDIRVAVDDDIEVRLSSLEGAI